MAAAAEQPLGPGPFARMAASSLVEVSAYVFLALPCPAVKGPPARPLGQALADSVPRAHRTARPWPRSARAAGDRDARHAHRPGRARTGSTRRPYACHRRSPAAPAPATGAAPARTTGIAGRN